jgi:hypothetical protein
MSNGQSTIAKRCILSISNDALILTSILAQLKQGEVVTYDSLSKALGRNVLECRGLLETARRRAQRETGVVVECVRGIGLMRVDGKELIDCQSAGIVRIRHEARRRWEKISKVTLDKLDDAGKVKAAALQSIFGAISQMSASGQVKRIEAAVEKSKPAPLSLVKTLELFR